MNSPLYLVTGAAGFVGSELVRQLVAEGHRVRGLVRKPEQMDALRERGLNPSWATSPNLKNSLPQWKG